MEKRGTTASMQFPYKYSCGVSRPFLSPGPAVRKPAATRGQACLGVEPGRSGPGWRGVPALDPLILARGHPARMDKTIRTTEPRQVSIRALGTLFLLALAAALSLSCSHSAHVEKPHREAAGSDLVIDRPVVAFEAGSAGQLAFDNPLGDLHLRSGNGDTVEVTLFVQRWSGDQAGAEIRRVEREGRWYVSVGATSAPDGSRPLRADAVVRLPSRLALRLYTDFGAIDARELASPSIQALSVSGDILLVAASPVDARTGSGRIRATFTGRDEPVPRRLATHSGDIFAFLPSGARGPVHARTRGALTTGWGAEIVSGPAGKLLDTGPGSGADALVVVSETGRVELHEFIAKRPAGDGG